MSERFKLEISPSPTHDQYCIIDTEQDILTIYGDLGCIYFTSAPMLCDLLNDLDKENKRLKDELDWSVKCADKFYDTLSSFMKRDLNDIERIFLKNFCKELGVDLDG